MMENMGETLLHEGKFLRLVKLGRWEYAERVNATGAVMIFAQTEDRKIILVEEYRYPMHGWTIGLPAGISGDEGPESTLETARRELLEETGYEAEHWRYLCDGPSSPGLATEMVSFYLASGLKRISSGGGVDHEKIVVHAIPISGIESWLHDQTLSGKVIDPRIYMALYFLEKEKLS